MRTSSGDHITTTPLSQNGSSHGRAPYPPPAAPAQTPAPPPAARRWPTPSELVDALKRRLVLAALLGLLAGAAAGAGVWLALPAGTHEARGLLEMRPHPPLVGEAAREPNFEDFKKDQLVLVKTRPLLKAVVEDPRVGRTTFVTGSDDPVGAFGERLRVRWVAPSLLAVSLTGDDPAELKLILDALLAGYVEQATADERLRRGARLADVDGRIAELTKRIEQAEAQARPGFKMGATGSEVGGAAKLTLLAQESQALATQIASLSRAAMDANRTLADDTAQLARIGDLPVDAREVLAIVQASDGYAEKAARVAKAEVQLARERDRLQPGAPLLQTYEAELQQLRAGLKELEAQLTPAAEFKWRAGREKALRASVDRGAERLQAMRGEIAALTEDKKTKDQQIADVAVGEQAIRQARARLAPDLAQRDVLRRERAELTSLAGNRPTVSVREEAAVSLNHTLNWKIPLAIAGATFGFGLALLAVAFAEWRSRRVDSAEQVVNELGLRVIGTIPARPRAGAAAQAWRSVLNESVTSARTMLLHAARTQNMQVLMVTSAVEGEGKTSLAGQLATSMAAAGLRTLVLDGDLRNPSVHRLFDAPLAPGCAEVLCQEVDVSDAVQPTAVPNLWVVPAGRCTARVVAALAQGHPLEALFNRLRGQFDVVVVDACPVLPVADALLFGQHVDGVVLSVLRAVSRLPTVRTASDRLAQLSIPVLGAVVNGVRPDAHAYGYNYAKQLPA